MRASSSYVAAAVSAAAGLADDQCTRQALDAAQMLAGDHLEEIEASLASEILEIHVDAGKRRPRRLRDHFQLSKPTIDTASGTTMPRSRSASAVPRAIWSLPQKMASGGRRRPLKSWATASRPQSSDHTPLR